MAERKSKRWVKFDPRRHRPRRTAGRLTPDEELDIHAIMQGVMDDPYVHAATILAGRTAFRNRFLAGLRGIRRQCEAMIAEGRGEMNGARARLRMVERMNAENIVEFAWTMLTTWGWRETLIKLSAEMGYPPEDGLPMTTTPAMVYDQLDRPPEDDPEPPEDEREVEINTNLSETAMRTFWDTSSRQIKGKVRDIKALSKREQVHRGLADGSIKIVD